MSLTLKGGLIIGGLCAVWMYVIGFTGWYKDPALQAMFWVVVLIEIGVLYWMLRQLPEPGKTFGGILKAGTMMSLIAAVVIFVASYLFTSVVFPNYFEEVRVAGEAMYRAQGMTEEQVAAVMASMAPMQNSTVNAIMGSIGTIVTGFLASAVLGLILKKKTA
jgi:hypothetical protein